MRTRLAGLLAIVGAMGAATPGCGGDGTRCTVRANDDGTATLSCDDGTSFVIRNGADGTDGTDGTDGGDGTSCTVSTDGEGVRTITCEDGTMVTIPPGETGPTGEPGRNALLTGPGLRMDVRATGVDGDRHPFAELRFTDAAGRPLDREGLYTEGAITVGFSIAHLPTESRVDGETILPFQSYLSRSVTGAEGTGLQPIADSGGTWEAVDATDGVYRYTYGATLPADYDPSETHLAGIWATRTFDDVRFVANASPTFRPDGMAVETTRAVLTNEGCNTCHDPMSAHGGSRQDVGVCVSCHGRGFTDPDSGESLDFDIMIHRIHRGESLPSVENGEPYQIIGFRGSVHDFSSVVLPQDIRNCETCHAGSDAALPTLQPSRAACTSCHDDIWFEAGDPPESWMRLHPGGDRPDDSRCTVCHEPTGGLSPIVESHMTKWEVGGAEGQLPALAIDAVSLTAERNVQLDFRVTVGGNPRDVLTAPLASLSVLVAGPSSDYLFNASFSATNASAGTLSAIDAAAGRFRWVSASTVEQIAASAAADALRGVPGIAAEGTWAVGMQGTLRFDARTTGTVCSGSNTSTCGPAPEGGSWACVSSACTVRYTYPAGNPVAYLAITDSAPAERREVVSLTSCQSCHQQLELHGGGRNEPEYCVMCHSSTFDTADRMPVPSGGTSRTMTASFAGMVHRIHTGEDGVSPATWWAPRPSGAINLGGSPVDFSEVRYPGDLRACDTCHAEQATATDFAHMLDLRPVRTRTIDDTRTTVDEHEVGAITAACTGCHDDASSAAHAASMTSALGVEACVTCHGPGEAFGADVVHARPEIDLR